MRVFVTGATGFIGSAIVQDLMEAGHQVTGLARSEAAAKALSAIGAKVHRGDIEDLESLKTGAAAADGVIHTAFNHDFSKFKENCENDRKAIEALGLALEGTDRPLVIASGTALVSPGRLASEDYLFTIDSNTFPRVASEEVGKAIIERGVRLIVVRLAPSVHGEGDHGFVPMLINIARQKGVSAYVEEGKNRWNAVHRLDAANLFRLALEKGTTGARFHGVAEEEVPFKEIAAAIGKGLGLPVKALTTEQANQHFGWFALFAGLDCPASSQLTRQCLGWSPKHSTLLKDLEPGSRYFLE